MESVFGAGKCLLFQFLIKPQLEEDEVLDTTKCLLFQFLIKPQQLFIKRFCGF